MLRGFQRQPTQRKIILFLVAAEIAALLVLGIYVLSSLLKEPSTASVSPIASESVFNPESSLKHFIEPRPNSHSEHKVPTWDLDTRDIVYAHNNIGARSENDNNIEKPAGTYRIVLLGDSHPYGLFVKEADIFSTRLQDALNEDLSCTDIRSFEVVNLAYTGYDAEFALERFILRGKILDPDLVIWNINHDDLIENSEWIYKYLNTHAISITSQSEIYDIWQNARDALDALVGPQAVIDHQLAKLRSIRDVYEDDLLILTLNNSGFGRTQYKALKQQLATVPPQIDAYYLHIDHPEIPKTGVHPDTHLNPTGHRLVAQELFTFLTQQILSDMCTASYQ